MLHYGWPVTSKARSSGEKKRRYIIEPCAFRFCKTCFTRIPLLPFSMTDSSEIYCMPVHEPHSFCTKRREHQKNKASEAADADTVWGPITYNHNVYQYPSDQICHQHIKEGRAMVALLWGPTPPPEFCRARCWRSTLIAADRVGLLWC